MNNGTKITSPISLHGDVYPVLAIAPSGAYYDVAEVCRSGKINKWSFKKPIRFAQFPELTDAQIMSVNCGLTPNDLGLLRRNCNGLNGVTGGDDSKADILAEVSEWNYMQPNEYYRLTDFDGYNHAALPSDRGWEDYTFTRSELSAFADNDAYFIPPSSENSVNFTIPNNFKIMTKFAMRISEGSGNYIGNAEDNMLPLTYAAGGGFIEGQSWRIAYAVEIGSEWYLFIGRKPLDSSLSVTDTRNYCPPDMSSNTVAVRIMLDSGQSSFTMIPCLVRNATIAFTAIDSSKKRSYIQVNSDTLIYAMPSGTKSVRLNITSSESMPQIDGVTSVAKDGLYDDAWVLGYRIVGQGGSIPIQQAIVITKVAPSNESWSGTIKVRFKYHRLDNNMNDQYLQYPPNSGSGAVGTFTIKGSDRISITYGGKTTTYCGIVLNDSGLSGLGFYIEPKDVEIFSVD